MWYHRHYLCAQQFFNCIHRVAQRTIATRACLKGANDARVHANRMEQDWYAAPEQRVIYYWLYFHCCPLEVHVLPWVATPGREALVQMLATQVGLLKSVAI
jgi:hypothetical protein